jgi:hypothetical protein
MDFFYRFRSIDALLGSWKELEKQEIYFARPDQLNDPMEGFTDLVWFGDKIAWTNLIKHYLVSLQLAVSAALLTGDDYSEAKFPINVFASASTLPTVKAREIHRNICVDLFKDPDVAALPELLAMRRRRIRREELEFYLRAIHCGSLHAVLKVFRTEGLLPGNSCPLRPPEPMAAVARQVLNTVNSREPDDDRDTGNHFFAAASKQFRQTELKNYLVAKGPTERLWQLIAVGFPDRYINYLRQLVYSDWYVASFVANPNDAAMWGIYGSRHTGVCLKFRATKGDDGAPHLRLRQIVEWGFGPNGVRQNYGKRLHRFERISYVDKFPEIDFFRYIGRIQAQALRRDWYRDENGVASSCADEILSNADERRRRYWETFQATVTAKLRDWEHEGEYRLILNDAMRCFCDPADRTFVYEFDDLAGIIFGINTTLEDRMSISNVLLEKCRSSGRSDFEFAQAYYAPQTGKIETCSFNLLNSEPGLAML